MDKNSEKYSHYYKDVSNLKVIDVYRVLSLFEVTNPCIQHAVKKLLCTGKRGQKDFLKDVVEARDTLNRFLEMEEELIQETVKEKEEFKLDLTDLIFVESKLSNRLSFLKHKPTDIMVELPLGYVHNENGDWSTLQYDHAFKLLTEKVRNELDSMINHSEYD